MPEHLIDVRIGQLFRGDHDSRQGILADGCCSFQWGAGLVPGLPRSPGRAPSARCRDWAHCQQDVALLAERAWG